MTPISRNIMAHLKLHDLTKTQFADKLGVSSSTVCGLTNRRAPNPRLGLLLAVCKELEITIDQLIKEPTE